MPQENQVQETWYT